MKSFKAIKIACLCLAFVLAAASCQEKSDGPDDYVVPSIDLKLDTFGFLAVNNPLLDGEDAWGRIEGDTVYIDCPGVTSLNQMIPTFSGSYVKVLVDGVKITPGQSVVNFSKAREVVLQGYSDSKTKKYSLCIRIQNLIPKVSLRTGSEITSRTEYQTATVTVTNYPYDVDFTASGKAKGRGNATFLSYPKKSYKFKLDESRKVCGFRKNRDWVLLAEYCDKSLMRTTYMNALSKAAGCEWTPESAHVELYLNGSYNGVYLLTEQVEEANHKIEISDDGFIIEDDYDSEFRFSGRPIPTLQSIDREGRVIYMNTFSQTISPSMRVGFMVLPPRLLEQYRRELDFYACTVPVLDQHVLARFLSGGHYEQHLSRMRKEYRSRRAAVIEAFQSSAFADRVTFSEQDAGLHFLLRLNTPKSDEALRQKAERLGVKLAFLSEYAAEPDPAYAHTLVVNYGGLEPARLRETVSLLEAVFSDD